MDARAGATPKQLTNYDAASPPARRAASRSGVRTVSLLAYLQTTGAKHGRIQYEPAGGDFGGWRDDGRVLTNKLNRSVSAPRFAADGAYLLFLVATIAPSIRRASRSRAARCSVCCVRPRWSPRWSRASRAVIAVNLCERCEERRSLRVREQRSPRAHPSQRRTAGRTAAGSHRGVHLQGQGRQRGSRPDGEAARLRGGQEVSYAAARSTADPTGRTRTRSTSSGSSSQPTVYVVLAVQLPRQLRARRGLPGRDLGRLGQQGSARPAGGGGSRAREPVSADPDRLGVGGWSYGRNSHRRDDRQGPALQGRYQRRGALPLPLALYGVDQ